MTDAEIDRIIAGMTGDGYAEAIAKSYDPDGWALAAKRKGYFELKLAERRRCKSLWSRLKWWLYELWQEEELLIAANAPVLEHYRAHVAYNTSFIVGYKDWIRKQLAVRARLEARQ